MKQIIQNSKSGEINILDVPEPQCGPNGVLVKSSHSVISTGTEKVSVATAKSSLIGKAKLRPDLVSKVIDYYKKNGLIDTYNLVNNRLNSPMPLGYSCAGRIIEVGSNVDNYRVNDLVACGGGGYALHSDINFIPQNLITKVNENVSLHSAAYVTIGAIAMQGVRQANAKVGCNVVVLGLGLVGQLTAQILQASGCNVIGVDISDFAIKVALGNDPWSIDHAFNSRKENVPEEVMNITNGIGADSVIITASSSDNKPLLLSGKLIRDRGVIVIVGGTDIKIPRSPFYDKEAEIKFSRSYGPGRYDVNYEEKGIDYPVGYVRWTENRNMQSFQDLISAKKINPEILTTQRFPIENAEKAFEMILNPKQPFMGLVLDYSENVKKNEYKLSGFTHNDNLTKKIKIGFIGLGNFAQTFIMPHLVNKKNVALISICNSSGMSSNNSMNKYGFNECFSDPVSVLKSQDNNTIFISSRHDSHGDFIIRALKEGKNIYVEKPIALNRKEFEKIISTIRNGYSSIIHVGYNRRFADASIKIKEIIGNRSRPLSILYRINAGFLSKDFWLVDKEIGGGRIIGEICHFIDFIIFLTDSKIVDYKTTKIINRNSNFNNRDNLHIQLLLHDGSVASIIYNIDGSKNLTKEYIEIAGGEKSFIIDDFSKCIYFSEHGDKKIISKKNDKGYKTQINLFSESLIESGKPLIDFDQIINGMDVTLSIDENLNN